MRLQRRKRQRRSAEVLAGGRIQAARALVSFPNPKPLAVERFRGGARFRLSTHLEQVIGEHCRLMHHIRIKGFQ